MMLPWQATSTLTELTPEADVWQSKSHHGCCQPLASSQCSLCEVLARAPTGHILEHGVTAGTWSSVLLKSSRNGVGPVPLSLPR